jgi:pimeloyl-ACP methyl ester carboxylesterase
MANLSTRELEAIESANASGPPPVVFVHGLWMLSGSWDPWRELFAAQGFATLAPDWPDDPATVGDARAHPEVLAGKSVGAVTDHYAAAIERLDRKPAVVGHSFGGLITQRLAGRGLASVSVPIDSGPFRGVLPLPVSALRAAWPVIGNRANHRRSVMLSYDDRGPMKIISGQRDHTVPWAIANASYKKQRRNPNVTEIEEIPDRGHSLVFDGGWKDVANVALDFIQAHSPKHDPDLRTDVDNAHA